MWLLVCRTRIEGKTLKLHGAVSIREQRFAPAKLQSETTVGRFPSRRAIHTVAHKITNAPNQVD
jgi:hypothetical protein